MKISIVAALMVGSVLSCCGVYAGGLSSLTVRDVLDSNANPAARAADSGPVVIRYSGAWFGQEGCEFYVDGALVGTSAASEAEYVLAAGDGSWRSYRLTLKSGGSSTTRFVTVFPTSDFACSLHSLTQSRSLLDSRPASVVRRVRSGVEVDVAWSGLWNDAADRSVVSVYKGRGVVGEPLCELVAQEGRGEGWTALSDDVLPPGIYTLTHFDGVETLVACLNLAGGGFSLIVR